MPSSHPPLPRLAMSPARLTRSARLTLVPPTAPIGYAQHQHFHKSGSQNTVLMLLVLMLQYYTNGDNCGAIKRSAHVKLLCDPSLAQDIVVSEADGPPCNYEFVAHSASVWCVVVWCLARGVRIGPPVHVCTDRLNPCMSRSCCFAAARIRHPRRHHHHIPESK